MKKTKIILPAIALLAVSGIASVTGTVAWFTAANTATFATDAITAVATDSNLDVNHIASSVVNCTLNGKTIKQTNAIQDSSFKASSKEFYKAAFDTVTVDSSSHTTGVASTYYLSTTGVANSGSYCVSWISEFTAPNSTNDYDVYFDFQTSKMKATDENAANLQKAYRLYATEVTETEEGTNKNVTVKTYGSHSFVWGYSAAKGDLTYVNQEGDATADNATDSYDSESTPVGVFGTGTNKALSTQTKETARGNAGYLGVIPATGDSKKLMVQFVVYCEGTDNACISAYENQSIASSLTFYSRNVAGYAAGKAQG